MLEGMVFTKKIGISWGFLLSRLLEPAMMGPSATEDMVFSGRIALTVKIGLEELARKLRMVFVTALPNGLEVLLVVSA